MELVEIYSAMQSEQITLVEAAKLFGMSERNLKFRITRWGHRLPLLLSVLDKIRRGQISRDEAAEALGVSTREVNALCGTWNVQRPVAKHRVMRAAAGIKRELRKKYAIDYIAGRSTVEDAAEEAQCSERQLRRWVSDLLQKHFGMVWKDLRFVTLRRRSRLADEIETAENLDFSKQQVLRSLEEGKKTLMDLAIEQTGTKKVRRRYVQA